MPSPRLKFLLLQAREPDDAMKDHEQRCFVNRMGLEPQQVQVHDLLEGPPAERHAWAYDALLVGGAGAFHVSTGDLPAFDETQAFFRAVVERRHPMFASCFGYHCLVAALGGEIQFDPANTEVGTFPLTLTSAGRQDELFGALPGAFMAQEGHKDRATRHPGGVPNLAGSELSPMQAMRIPGATIWATQFHPELDRTTNLDRLYYYMDQYAKYLDEAQRQEAIGRFQDSPDTPCLLPAFLELVFG